MRLVRRLALTVALLAMVSCRADHPSRRESEPPPPVAANTAVRLEVVQTGREGDDAIIAFTLTKSDQSDLGFGPSVLVSRWQEGHWTSLGEQPTDSTPRSAGDSRFILRVEYAIKGGKTS